jgi:hypothetical protein
MTTMLAPVGMRWQRCDPALRLQKQIRLGTSPQAASLFATKESVQSETHELRMPSGHAVRARRYGNAIRPRGIPPV